jgi:uncharacterized protein with HEPN domain
MPSRDDGFYLGIIKENIGYARLFVGAMTFEDFLDNIQTFYAATRALEIISEASRGLSEALKKRNPSIARVAVRDAGNIYRHGYEYVTQERVGDTATKSLAPLEAVVDREIAGI